MKKVALLLIILYNKNMSNEKEEMAKIEKVDDIRESLLQKLQKAQNLLNKCFMVMQQYTDFCLLNGQEPSLSVDFAQSIYHSRKEELEKNKQFKKSLLEQLKGNESIEKLKDVVRQIEESNLTNNETFVNDALNLLENSYTQSSMNKFASKIVIDYFVNYVNDQKKLSTFDVSFYQELLLIEQNLLKKEEVEKEQKKQTLRLFFCFTADLTNFDSCFSIGHKFCYILGCLQCFLSCLQTQHI